MPNVKLLQIEHIIQSLNTSKLHPYLNSYKGYSQFLLLHLETLKTFLSPCINYILGEMCQWNCNLGIFVNVPDQIQKTSNLCDCLQLFPRRNDFYFFQVDKDTFLKYDRSQELYLFQPKLTFSQIGIQLLLLQYLQNLTKRWSLCSFRLLEQIKMS